jgi:hypothetical protein
MPIKTIALKLVGRWKQLVGGLVAALVLLPVPAMALTFSGSWKAVILTKGKPLPPKPTFADVTNNAKQKDQLTVNMGNYQGVKTVSVSSIELTRRFSISAPSQQLQVEDQLFNQFARSGGQVTVVVKDMNGHVVTTPLRFRTPFPPTNFGGFTPFGDGEKFQSSPFSLKKGHYIFDVKIVYRSGHHGGWKTISPHQFEFVGF